MPALTRVGAGLASVSMLLAGCSTFFDRDDPCDLTSPPSPKVLTEPGYPQVGEAEANVAIMVNNSGAPSRVTVRLDDKVALDVELPDSDGCAHSPVYTYYYNLQAGRIEVTAEGNDGRSTTEPMLVDDRIKWALVTTQESFPMRLVVSRAKPGFA